MSRRWEGLSVFGMNRLRSCLASLHRDEQGDEGVNKLLIVALIVVPLLIALIAFKDKLVPFFEKAWKSIVK